MPQSLSEVDEKSLKSQSEVDLATSCLAQGLLRQGHGALAPDGIANRRLRAVTDRKRGAEPFVALLVRERRDPQRR
jgi:hypothetical protein